MNSEFSNETRDIGRERVKLQFDQTAWREWLSTEVQITLPRWTLVAAGAFTLLLLLVAID